MSAVAQAGALRLSDGVTLRDFDSSRADRPFRMESGAMRVTLRPVGSHESALKVERELGLERVIAANRVSAESIAYEIADTSGVLAAVPFEGGIRFMTRNRATDRMISAPLVVDAAGRPSTGARWALTPEDPQGHQTMHLVVDDASLRYPVTVSYRVGSSERPLASAFRPSNPIVNATGAISGLVTDEVTGGPVADQYIAVYNGSGDIVTYAISDSAGRYTTVDGLATGSYYVAIYPTEHNQEVYNNHPCNGCDPVAVGNAVSVTDGATTSNINFALTPTYAHVTGIVTSGTAPLSGVTVLFYDRTGSAVASANSDDNGNYDALVFAAGTPYKARTFNSSYAGLVDVLYNGITCIRCDISTGTSINVTPGGTTSGINFNLVSGGQISGSVTETGGAPIYQANINVYNSSGVRVATAQTDLSGNYTVINGLSPANYYVVASAFDHTTKLYNNITCNGCNPTTGTAVAVTSGQVTSGINFVLTSTIVPLSGRVTDASTSAGIANVYVLLYNSSGQQVALGVTDSNGDYSTTVDAGTYYAKTENSANSGYIEQLYNNIDCTGCNPTGGTAITATAGSSVSNINFALRTNGGKIAGRITDADTSAAIPFASVAVYNSSGLFVTYAIADANGDYLTFDGLTAGNYYATAWASGYATQLYANISCANGCNVTTGTAISVSGGQTTSGINFALNLPIARISGNVSAASDASPIPGANVLIYDTGGSVVASVSTNASGDYTASVNASGTYYAVATAVGYTDQAWDNHSCNSCDPTTTGDAITATIGATVSNINFLLQTSACGFLSLSPSTLPDGQVGVAYSEQLTANGATGTVTFSVTDGGLPNGVTLNGSTGVISGTPSVAGTFAFVISASDSGTGCSTARAYSVDIDLAPGTTTIVLHVVPNPAVYGDTVTLTANVSPDTAVGTVTFKKCNNISDCSLGTTALGTGTLDVNGTATLQLSNFNAGSYTLLATYEGSSNPKYDPSTSDPVGFTVDKFAPNINWPTPANITWGTALSGTQLNATATGVNGASLAGTFVYSPAAGTVLEVGTHTLTVSFAASDSANYTSPVFSTVNITVVKATPVIVWIPGAYTYGDPLGAAQLNAQAYGVDGLALAGSYVYNPAAGTILSAGNNTLNVSFTPTDTTHYNSASDSVTLNAAKADPLFSNLSAPSIIIGTPTTTVSGKISLGPLIPTGSVSITINGVTQSAAIQANGTFSSTFNTSALVPPGYTITYSYAGDSNFNAATATTTLSVHYNTAGTKVSAGNNGGGTIPFRVTVSDYNNTNLASSSLQVVAYGVRLVTSSTWLPAPSNGNQGSTFQLQSNGTYMFTLSTNGLAAGNYVFGYTVGSDTTIYTISFTVK